MKKELSSVLAEFRQTFDTQQLQTQAQESLTRASGEQIKTLEVRIEQMTGNAFVNNAPDMRNAQMNDALA